jgi:transposase
MVVLGVDAHKRTHTIVAVDDRGKQIGSKVVAATPAGHVDALKWTDQWSERLWAIEDCRALSRRLEQDLLRAGQAVVRIPPKLMAVHRRSVRTPGKSDPIDALAVAHAAQREGDLPAARLDGPEREIRLLVDHRDDIVTERTRIENRLHLHLHELKPGLEIKAGSLKNLCVLDELLTEVQSHAGVVADIAAELIGRCRELTRRANQLEREIDKRVREFAPTLLLLVGCGALSAAKIIGEVATVSRFKSRDAFAMHNGTAPIPVWSANKERYRLNRGGNRQINAAIHRIAITQKRMHQPAKNYIDKRMTSGDSKREALRMLRRRISNEVYKRLLMDEQVRYQTDEILESSGLVKAA